MGCKASFFYVADTGSATDPQPMMAGGLLAQSVGWDLFRDDLLEAFTAYCGSERALPLSGFLSFADSFDISAYLSPERVAEIFETATGQGKKSSVCLLYTSPSPRDA